MVEEQKQEASESQHILSTKENTEAWLTEKQIPFHVSFCLKEATFLIIRPFVTDCNT